LKESRTPAGPVAARRAAAAALVLAACGVTRPPGVEDAPTALTLRLEPASPPAEGGERTGAEREGTVDDNLPFLPDGTKLYSTAYRTWIYTDVGPRRRRYGYLRAGEAVDARGPAISNAGCQGGWYRINPRGFVCLAKGATLDPAHALLAQAEERPARGQPLPYHYFQTDGRTPLRYFKLPDRREVLALEGDRGGAISVWQGRWGHLLGYALEQMPAPPAFLEEGGSMIKPYGVKEPLRYRLHAGRAEEGGAFAIKRLLKHAGRAYGITTEHDLLALDNLVPRPASKFRGLVLTEEDALPVAFIKAPIATRYEGAIGETFRAQGALPKKTAVKLTGRKWQAFHELQGGGWVPSEALDIVQGRKIFPSFATGSRKWVDVSLREQTLVAYAGKRPVYVTLVSTGRAGLADPATTTATVTGTFMIHSKHLTSTMDAAQDRSDSYALQDVPYVQYFHKGYALHGAYWHDDFGRPRSHGCINLAPYDAAWLFEWTDPELPPKWHGVLNQERGTVVQIGP
jgi:hypothetical protein